MGVLRSTQSMQAKVEENQEMRVALFHGAVDVKRAAAGDQEGTTDARTVYVTGGISFIGFAIIDRLLRHGYTVRLALKTQGQSAIASCFLFAGRFSWLLRFFQPVVVHSGPGLGATFFFLISATRTRTTAHGFSG